MSERWHAIRDKFEGWGGAAMVVLGLALLVVGAKVPATRPHEAQLIALAAPLVPLAISFFATREAPTRVRIPVTAVALAVAVVAEVLLVQALVPPKPFAEVTFNGAARDTAVQLPDDAAPFDVEVHAALATATGNGSGRYWLELERAGKIERLGGHVERKTKRVRRVRRMGPMTATTAHQTDVFRRTMPGTGDLAVRLADTDGNIANEIHVLFRPLPVGATLAPRALIALAVFALGVETWARRVQVAPGLFAPVAFVTVFAIETMTEMNRDDPFSTVMGVGLLAAIAALVAWGIGRIAGRIAAGPPAAGGDPLAG